MTRPSLFFIIGSEGEEEKFIFLFRPSEPISSFTYNRLKIRLVRFRADYIIMEKEFLSAIDQICEERGIAKEKVLETIEIAIAAAYKKDYGKKGQNIRAKLNLETGQVEIFQVKLAVDESMLKPESELETETEKEKEEKIEEEEKKIRFNPEKHLMVEEAKKIKKKIKPGEELWIPLAARQDYGRIAAQTAKQVIIQKIREAEREATYNEYKEKQGQVLSGLVQRIEKGNVFFDLGRASGLLFREEQIPGEYYKIGQRFRVYLIEVQKEGQGPMILLSRTHPEMINRLFEIEVPEIAAGTVMIKLVAREAGSRSKIAVLSTEERIDPIGSCIGQKGTRVQTVINELGGEKIDIIEWQSDPTKFIANALAPAKVIDVKIEEKERRAIVEVAEDQLSLAIGKKGQNVRLAAKLTGWKIDIVSTQGEKIETKVGKEEEEKIEKEEKGKK